MGTEDRKEVQILLNNGASINVITRMPYDSIDKEVYWKPRENGETKPDDPHPELVKLMGIDGGPEEGPVEITVYRHLVMGTIIGKFHPRVVRVPPQGKPGGLIQ